jgi:hypothetical protein
MSIRRFSMALSLLTACALPSHATPTHATAADTVTRLADEFVADYKRRFPFTVMYTGLPLEIQSDIDKHALVEQPRRSCSPSANPVTTEARYA